MELNHYLFECNSREQMRARLAEADADRLAKLARAMTRSGMLTRWALLAVLRDALATYRA